MLQVPLNTSTLQRNQCYSYLQGANFIPAGAILFTHTPVIIPNAGLTNGNAIEVLYSPQTPATVLPQMQTTPHGHTHSPLLHQHQLNSSYFNELKTQDYPVWVKDLVQLQIQNSKQEDEVRRNEAHSSLFTDQKDYQKSTNSQTSILQRLLVNNDAVNENPTNPRTSEQSVNPNI